MKQKKNIYTHLELIFKYEKLDNKKKADIDNKYKELNDADDKTKENLKKNNTNDEIINKIIETLKKYNINILTLYLMNL